MPTDTPVPDMPYLPDEDTPTCEPQSPAKGGPAPAPFKYQGETVTPTLDPSSQQWGFTFHGRRIPLGDPGC